MRRYIEAEKVIEEFSKVPWFNQDDERQAVRIVKEFSAADNELPVDENLISREQAIEKVIAPTDETLNAVIDAIARSIAELSSVKTNQHIEYMVNEDE